MRWNPAACLCVLLVSACCAPFSTAQLAAKPQIPSRIVEPIDSSQLVPLKTRALRFESETG